MTAAGTRSRQAGRSDDCTKGKTAAKTISEGRIRASALLCFQQPTDKLFLTTAGGETLFSFDGSVQTFYL